MPGAIACGAIWVVWEVPPLLTATIVMSTVISIVVSPAIAVAIGMGIVVVAARAQLKREASASNRVIFDRLLLT